MRIATKPLVLLALCLVVVVACTNASVQAGIVHGFNPVLSGSGGRLFISMAPETSGTLGDLIVGGPDKFGLQTEEVKLDGFGDTSEGWIRFPVQFDMSGQGLENIPTDLELRVDDLDFFPSLIGSKIIHTEVMELTFLRNFSDFSSVDPNAAPDLLIDISSYMSFRTGPAGIATNNVDATYEVSFVNDLGITDDDIAAVRLDNEFAILVKVKTTLESITSGKTTLSNTDEGIDFWSFSVAPEPGTMVMLILGGLGVLARRRRRRVV